MMRNPLPAEKIEIGGCFPADTEGLEKQHTRRLKEHYAWELKQIRHERKSVEKLFRAIEYYADDGPSKHEWWLGHLLVAFYRNQPTKLYDVILQILGPECKGCPGNPHWRKELNFEAFLQYKSEDE